MDTDTARPQGADVVDSARDKTQERADEAVEKGRGVVRAQVDSRSTRVGQEAQSVAETLRRTATELRGTGDERKARYARIADQGADRLDRVGGYLAESDADELLSKVEDVARRQPWLTAGTGLFLGIAAARFLKATSSERYYQRQPMDGTRSTSRAQPGRLPELEASRVAIPATPTA